MFVTYDKEQKLWMNSQPGPLSDLQMSQGQLILNCLSVHGSKVAQINADNGRQLTYNEMRLKTIRTAQNLLKRGFESRQVFGFMAGNSDHLVPVFLASICLACPVVPLHPMLSKDEIIHVLSKTKPSVVFCDASAYKAMNAALKELKWNVKVFILEGQIDRVETVENLMIETGDESSFVPVEYNVETDIAGIFCSSGTTGPSKCACLSYKISCLVPENCDSSDIVFSFESIYWTVGIKPICDCIHSGATRVITTKEFSSELQLKLIEKYRISILYIPPYELVPCLKSVRINKTDLSSMKTIRVYGCKLAPTLIPTINRYFPNAKCFSIYGMTEIGALTNKTIDNRGKSSGELLRLGRIAKIVDENGNRCGENVNGEICFKLQGEFLGYLDDPAANATVTDEDGFLRTGDIGHFDENGILSIEDRKKNVSTVYYFDGVILPSEIEECLIAMPDIQEVCVVGIPVQFGAVLPAAVVVRKPKSSIGPRDVFNVVAEHFPSRSRLRGGVYLVESLPTTHNGKLIRKQITELATEMFKTAKENDPDIQSYLKDIPEEFRKLI